MKLKSKIREYHAASNAMLTVAMMSFAADLTFCYAMVFVFGWDWQDPVHTGLPWLIPIGICTALTMLTYKASERLYFKAQDLEDKARLRASVRRIKRAAEAEVQNA